MMSHVVDVTGVMTFFVLSHEGWATPVEMDTHSRSEVEVEVDMYVNVIVIIYFFDYYIYTIYIIVSFCVYPPFLRHMLFSS
jgi:hypothetical protein